MIVAMACAICLLIAVGVARYFNELDVHKGIVSKSQAIHSRLDAATKFVAQQGGMKPTIERFIAKYGNPQQMSDDDKHEVLKQVPIFAAMRIGREGAEKEHYRFRVFSDEPRKKDNLATPEELAIFKRFEKDPALEEIVSDTGKVVTVFRPVRLSQAQGCLTCHGDPATSPWKNGHDILGFRMENWQDGKLHGVFALSTNVDEIKAVQAGAEWMSTDKQIGFYIGIGALLALFCAALLIRKPLERVKAVSDKLVSDSAEVGAAVGQIFAVSQDLSSASSQQAASVQETAASIEEISAMVKKSAESASESEHASTSSKTSAEKGREIVTQMVASMQEINRSNDQVAKAVASGNEKISQIVSLIEEIGTKTKVINDIVFQTKLLSFNASVEAARAGEHGKGFAVVAEEVGKLAQMSGNAAKEITGLLEESVGRVKGIVEETRQTVEQLMHEARTTVEKGSKVAQDCESMLTEIVESSNNVSQMVAGIATASQEQANGVFEISKAIRQIDQTTQIGSASAESCSSAAEQLSVKVKGLRGASAELRLVIDGKNTVNRFRWGSEYALGVTAMDDEHKVLIEKMNRLADIFEESRNPSREMLLEAFGDLASYTQKHFSDEEAFMESVNYPELGAHQGIHKALLAQVGEFGKRIEAGTCHGPDLMDFLNDWLMRHILNVDMKYSRYVKREGRGGDRGREKRAA